MPAEKTLINGVGPKLAGGLAQGAKGLASAMGKQLLSSAADKVGATTERLTEYAANGGGPGLMGAITGRGGRGRAKGSNLKVTNILEAVDIGVPVRLAYDQWTRFTDFPSFMKKVENVEQGEDEKLQWKAQVFWSHRTWESTILEQVPDRRIVWRSEGQKGSVDGAVTFHELGPDLTRVLLVLQYHPQGFMERTGNIWRAQGRRARLELKHFARHVMNEAILHPDDVDGWRGEIHDGQVVTDDDAEPGRDGGDAGSRHRQEPHRRRDRRESARAPRRAGRDEDRDDARPVRRGREPRRPAGQARE